MGFINKLIHVPRRIDVEFDDLVSVQSMCEKYGMPNIRSSQSKFHMWTHQLEGDCRLDVANVNGVWKTTEAEFTRWLPFRAERLKQAQTNAIAKLKQYANNRRASSRDETTDAAGVDRAADRAVEQK